MFHTWRSNKLAQQGGRGVITIVKSRNSQYNLVHTIPKILGKGSLGQQGFMLHKRRWCGYEYCNHSLTQSQVVQSDSKLSVSSTNKLRSWLIPQASHIEQSTVKDDTGRLGSFIECLLFLQFIKNSSALYNLSANKSDQQLVSLYRNNIPCGGGLGVLLYSS